MERMIRLPEILNLTGVSRSTIWRWIKAGYFPRPVRMSPGTIGWKSTDVLDWLASLSTN
ncbi:helix-turn-helix transcriptional regulator [Geobacter anodireducens]